MRLVYSTRNRLIDLTVTPTFAVIVIASLGLLSPDPELVAAVLLRF